MKSIGITEYVSIGRNYQNIPAKIDTGSDSSTIWASSIRVCRDGTLKFSLFDKGSKHYTGKVFKRKDFGVAKIKSSNGSTQMRYRTHLKIKVADHTINTLFYLADRSTQKFPILIGRRTIRGKFLVDVTKFSIRLQRPKRVGHNERLRKNPYQFHKLHKKELSL